MLILADQYVGYELPLAAKLGLLVGAFLLSCVSYALVENPIKRYAIGSRDELLRDANDSLTILIQHERPEGEGERNWLPAPPDAFNVVMRLYWPRIFRFALASLLVWGTGKGGLLGAAPGAPLGTADVSMHAGAIAVMVMAVVLIAAGLRWMWPALSPRAAPVPGRAAAGSAGGDGGLAAGLLLVLCIVTLAIWVSNPFAAALLVPALHLWMWIVVPDVRIPTPVAVVMLLAGLAPGILVAVYYMVAFGLGPVTAVWHLMLALAGGVLSPLWAIEWSVFAGCVVSVIAVVVRAARRSEVEEARVTIRGPVTYAGPGSLGGTKSALRR